MSNTTFVEFQSIDPIERAIARKVTRLLNDHTLDRQQRIDLVRKAQRQLLSHHKQQREAAELDKLVSTLPLPKNCRAVSVQVRQGQVLVGATGPDGFTWLEAGPVPDGLAANLPPRPLKTARKVTRRQRVDPIVARRRELRAGSLS